MKSRSQWIGLAILGLVLCGALFTRQIPAGAAQGGENQLPAWGEPLPLGSIPFTRLEIITGFPQPIDLHAADIDGDGASRISTAARLRTTGNSRGTAPPCPYNATHIPPCPYNATHIPPCPLQCRRSSRNPIMTSS